MALQKRRRPPYAAQIAQALREPRTWPDYAGTSPDGSRPTIWVAVGSEAWSWAGQQGPRRLVAVMPPDDSPEQFDWRPVVQFPPVLLLAAGAVDGHQVEALVRELLMAGAGRVLFLGPNGALLYRPPEPGEKAHG